MKPTSFKLDPKTADQLAALAAEFGFTKSATVRLLIQRAHQHNIDHVPHCASGNPCLMPALFAQNRAAIEMAERNAANADPHPERYSPENGGEAA